MHLAHRTTQLAAAGPGGHCALKVDREVVDYKVVVDKKMVDKVYMAVQTVVFNKNLAIKSLYLC